MDLIATLLGMLLGIVSLIWIVSLWTGTDFILLIKGIKHTRKK